MEEDLPEAPRVLLVDDDEVNLLLTSLALRDRGFKVLRTTNTGEKIQQTVRMIRL